MTDGRTNYLTFGYMWAQGSKVFDDDWNVVLDQGDVKKATMEYLDFFVTLTEHMPILAYRKAFRSYDVGMGATVSTISFLILTAAVLVYFRLFPLDTRD